MAKRSSKKTTQTRGRKPSKRARAIVSTSKRSWVENPDGTCTITLSAIPPDAPTPECDFIRNQIIALRAEIKRKSDEHNGRIVWYNGSCGGPVPS